MLDENVRLLTLTGPGGVGKTRVALEVASGLINAFAAGVWLVSLAPIADPALVVPAIARALGVQETADRSLVDRVVDTLREGERLIVLDNLEHLIHAAPTIADLIAASPLLKILITSRTVLHLSGEQVLPVTPLPLPDLTSLPPVGRLGRTDTVRLFVERTRAGREDFALTEANAAAVATICHRLDGLPLAIELAAARARLLQPAELLARLDRRLSILSGGPRDAPLRQQTLRQTLAWSHDLLNPAEQALFRRLAVFAGGCTLASAAAVGDASGDLGMDVIDGIATLVDHSLLRPVEGADDVSRFEMLETIREYALERLELSGEAEATYRQHARFFLTLAEEARPKLTSHERGPWLERLEVELDNLRAALAWREHHHADDVRLRWGSVPAWFWYFSGRVSEGREWIERAVAALDEATPVAARAEVLYDAGSLAWLQGDLVTGGARLDASVATWRALGCGDGLAAALVNLATVAVYQGDAATARPLLTESTALARMLGDRWLLVHSLVVSARAALLSDDRAAAGACVAEALPVARQLGDPWLLGTLHFTDGLSAWLRGDTHAARAALEEGVRVARAIDDNVAAATLLSYLARLAWVRSDYQEMAGYCDEWRTRCEAVGDRAGVARASLLLGLAFCFQGDAARARLVLTDSLLRHQHLGDELGSAGCLIGLARCVALAGHHERAAHMAGAAQALLSTVGPSGDIAARVDYDQLTATARGRIDGASLPQAGTEGKTMSLAQAIDLALADADPPAMPAPPVASLDVPLHSHHLTRRQVEVLRLLAAGLSNHEIAEALVLSVRTVEHHVAHIYETIDASGAAARAAATAYAFRHGVAVPPRTDGTSRRSGRAHPA